MKRICLFLLIVFLAASCSQNNNTTNTVMTSQQPDSTIGISASLSGMYISTAYLDALKETRSTKKSQKFANLSNAVISMIDGQAFLSTYWNFHEGGETYPVQLTSDKKIVVLGPQNNEPVYTLKNINDSMISLSDDKNEYILTRYTSDTILSSNEAIINSILLPDTYELNGKKIIFSKTGKVEGIDSLLSYSFNTDYNDAGMDFDFVFLTFKKDSLPQQFGYTFTDKSFQIFSLKCKTADVTNNDMCLEHTKGPVVYNFIKK